MTPAARLQATLELLAEAESTARPSDAVVSAFLRTRKGLGERDRGPILDLFQALLRHRARLGWWLARQGWPDSPRTRLIAFLALVQGRPVDGLRQLFTGDRFEPAALTETEIRQLGRLKGHTLDHPAMPAEIRVECPAWAVEPLRRRFGNAFEREMAAMLVPPPLDLRINGLRTTREAMLARLRELGLPAEPMKLAPHGIRLPQRLSLNALPMLKAGEIEIQDEGSQLVALLLDARPGERVVDFCAGAGGKTLAIATQMLNRGHVVACDISEGRLKRAAERFRQAGLHNIGTRLLSGESDRWVKRHKGGFDRVLVDAPCSGTGTWRRNPDARWRTAPVEADGEGGTTQSEAAGGANMAAGLAPLLSLQGRILASAARLVKPGGRLVYATCSLLAEENEQQVIAFLAGHPAFRLVPINEPEPLLAASLGEPGSFIERQGDCLSLTPARHGTDGFFAAILEREAAPKT